MANRKTVIAGLEAAELVITQDAYRDTATNRYADIVLPATLWAESDAVMVNSERNITLLQQSIPPPGQARPDWQLICQVAGALGFGEHFAYKSAASEIFDEIREFSNLRTGYDLRGASYDRLRSDTAAVAGAARGAGGRHDRHPIRYLNDGVSQDLFVDEDGQSAAVGVPDRRRGARSFFARPHMDADELPDDDYPIVLNTGRLQHQWHTMTKTGKVDKLNKLDSGPFVEVHPIDAVALDIADGPAGRAQLPPRQGGVACRRHRPGPAGQLFRAVPLERRARRVPDHQRVDQRRRRSRVSLQPEFKVCAVSLRPVKVVGAPSASDLIAPNSASATPDRLVEDEKLYLAGFLTGIGDTPAGVPVLPAGAPVRNEVRLWIDGLLAGRYIGPRRCGQPAAVVAAEARWCCGRRRPATLKSLLDEWPNGSTAPNWSTWTTSLADLAAARDVLVVTSTFGDGGPPDNGAAFWDRLSGTDAPALAGVRYAVLGIGDRSYDELLRSRQVAGLPAVRPRGDANCSSAPSARPTTTSRWREWADQVSRLLSDSGAARRHVADHHRHAGHHRRRTVHPRQARAWRRCARNIVLTAPASAKEVRQFGFDISEHDVAYSAGDSLGVFARNDPAVVDAWLAATGLRGEHVVEVDGDEQALRDALISCYDICRVTPNLMPFVAEHSRDAQARCAASSDKLRASGSNAMTASTSCTEFAVHADPVEWLRGPGAADAAERTRSRRVRWSVRTRCS